jgi:hypothetical protein
VSPMNPVRRFALNFVVYLVFGGGIFAFVSMRDVNERPSFQSVLVAALCLAVWSGALTTIIEVVTTTEPKQAKRTVIAGVLGACSLGGFATILSLLAWHGLPLGFIAIGVVAGGAMHAARAFSRGKQIGDAEDSAV